MTRVGPKGQYWNSAESFSACQDRSEKSVYLNVEPKYLTHYVAETALREDHRRMAPLPNPRCIGCWVPGTSTTGMASRMGVTAGTRFWRQGTGLRAQVGQQRIGRRGNYRVHITHTWVPKNGRHPTYLLLKLSIAKHGPQ